MQVRRERRNIMKLFEDTLTTENSTQIVYHFVNTLVALELELAKDTFDFYKTTQLTDQLDDAETILRNHAVDGYSERFDAAFDTMYDMVAKFVSNTSSATYTEAAQDIVDDFVRNYMQ